MARARFLRVEIPLVLIKTDVGIRYLYRGELIQLDEVGAPVNADPADVDRLRLKGALKEI